MLLLEHVTELCRLAHGGISKIYLYPNSARSPLFHLGITEGVNPVISDEFYILTARRDTTNFNQRSRDSRQGMSYTSRLRCQVAGFHATMERMINRLRDDRINIAFTDRQGVTRHILDAKLSVGYNIGNTLADTQVYDLTFDTLHLRRNEYITGTYDTTGQSGGGVSIGGAGGAPLVLTTPIDYNPASGTIPDSHLNHFVTDAEGKQWFIDILGNTMQFASSSNDIRYTNLIRGASGGSFLMPTGILPNPSLLTPDQISQRVQVYIDGSRCHYVESPEEFDEFTITGDSIIFNEPVDGSDIFIVI